MKQGPRIACIVIVLAWLTGCGDDTQPTAQPDAPMADSAAIDAAASPDAIAVPPNGLKLIDISNIADLTGDGRYALLQDMESPMGTVYVYDSYLDHLENRGSAANPDPAMGDTTRGTPPPPQGAFGMSADTSRIVGTHGMPLQAAFLAQSSWHDLGMFTTPICPGDPTNVDDGGSAGSGWDISDDGKTIVGMAWNTCAGAKAVRWTETSAGQGTFTELQSMGRAYNRATKVSADGHIVGGWFDTTMVDRSPAIWRADGTVIALDPTGMVIGEVLALTADGRYAAGPWNDTNGNNGFYWSQLGGVKMLPLLADAMPSDQVFPNAIAADGNLIFGGAGDLTGLGNVVRAFVWTGRDNRIRLLQDLVTQQGYTLPPNTILSNVMAASIDGSVVVGQTLNMDPALPMPKQRSFMLRMPLSAYGL